MAWLFPNLVFQGLAKLRVFYNRHETQLVFSFYPTPLIKCNLGHRPKMVVNFTRNLAFTPDYFYSLYQFAEKKKKKGLKLVVIGGL